jgi:hypothetical protein
MSSSDDVSMAQAVAKIALVEELLRLVMVERAYGKGRTPETVQGHASAIKKIFAERKRPGLSQEHLHAEIDRFYGLFAEELKLRYARGEA